MKFGKTECHRKTANEACFTCKKTDDCEEYQLFVEWIMECERDEAEDDFDYELEQN